MRNSLLLSAIGAVVTFTLLIDQVFAVNRNVSPIVNSLSGAPLAFTENMGQWPDSILFQASSGGTTMWFTRDGIYYQFTRRIAKLRTGEAALAAGLGPRRPSLPDKFSREQDSVETAVIKAEFVEASPSTEVVGLEELGYKCNYFIGNDHSKWRTDVPNYSSVRFRGVYPGVDATFSTKDGRLEEELLAASNTDLSRVQIVYRSRDTVTPQTDPITIVNSSLGEHQFKSVLLSNGLESNSEKKVSLATSSANAVSLVFSTYLGGNGEEVGYGPAVDAEGNVYVTGRTWSANFPIQSPFQASISGSRDVFVTKFSSAGSGLIYSTYLGGIGDDGGTQIAVDAAGNAYVTGYTQSTNFPTQNPFQASLDGGTDAFVTKLNSAGSGLIYSTYLGGSGNEATGGASIAVDAGGNAYVTGMTTSADFPIQNPLQASFGGGTDAFVTKLNSAGSGLIYSTYLGGSSYDAGHSVAVDGEGGAYVTGETYSSDFPITSPFQGSLASSGSGQNDAFVTKLSPSGNTLVYSTYLGGTSYDYGYGIAVDESRSAYVTGYTNSIDFPTASPFDGAGNSGWDAFVTKLSPAGASLIYSTYLGGNNGQTVGNGIAVDPAGSAYVTGTTSSSDFPVRTPLSGGTFNGTLDAFVTELSPGGTSLVYSTYLGGSSEDYGLGIAVDNVGNACVTGQTYSSDFPTATPLEGSLSGSSDAFVTKIGAVQGAANYAIQLDGIDDYIELPDNPSLHWDQQATIEFWVKLFDTDGGVAFNKWTNALEDKQMIFGESPLKLTFHLHGPEGSGQSRYSKTVFQTNQWYHVAGTTDGTTLYIYVNGVLDTSWVGTGAPIGNASNPARIGSEFFRYAGFHSINGEIDEFRLWNVYRTGDQIRAMMNKEAVGDEAGLVGLYHFDEGSGQVAHDATPSHNDGQFGAPPASPSWVVSTAPLGAGIPCNAETVTQTSPANSAIISTSPVTLNWSGAPCGTGYRLQYSSDPTFPSASSKTVTLDLPFESTYDIALPNAAARVYWRVFTLSGSAMSSPSPTWWFDYAPSGSTGITSAAIINPLSNTQFAYDAPIQPVVRLTSTWTGTVSGSWMVDGLAWQPISSLIQAGADNTIKGPSLPTHLVGQHNLQVALNSPTTLTSNTIPFTVSAPVFGPSSGLQITATPSVLTADGVSTSTISIMMVDAQGQRVWDDHGSTPAVSLMLAGSGSIPASAPFSEGVATVIYTAGASQGTAHIVASASLQSGAATKSIDIVLGPALDMLLSQHDFSRTYLSSMTMDMFGSPFNLPVWPKSVDMSAPEAFVNTQIRGETPSSQQVEMLRRLVLAEETAFKGYRFNPTSPNPFGGDRSIGGAQELAYSGVKNLTAAISGAIAVFSMIGDIADKANKLPLVGRLIAGALHSLGDSLLKWALGIIGKVAALLGDKEIQNTVMGLLDALEAAIHTQVDQSSLTDFITTPIITSPVTATFLSGYVQSTQSDLNQAAAWSSSGYSTGSFEAAQAHVEQQLASLADNSDQALNTIKSYEDQYDAGAEQLYQSLNSLWQKPNFSNITKTRDAFMNALTNLTGFEQIPFAIEASGQGFIAYGTDIEFIRDGMGYAYGGVPSSPGRGGKSGRTISSAASEQVSSVRSLRLTKLQTSLGSYSQWADSARHLAITHDTTRGTAVSESLQVSIDAWIQNVDLLTTIITASHDSATAAIPYFDSLYNSAITSVDAARWAQERVAMGLVFFLAQPSDTVFADSEAIFLDSSLAIVDRATNAIYDLRQTIFLTGALPMLAASCHTTSMWLYPGDTFTVTAEIANVGSGTATGDSVFVTADSCLRLITDSTVSLRDLAPGDSVVVTSKAIARWPGGSDTSGARSCAIRITPRSVSGLSQGAAGSAFVYKSCCQGKTGNVNGQGIVDLADLSALVSYLTGGGFHPPCMDAANVNGQGIVDLGDLTALVSYLTGGGFVLPNCP